MNEDRIREILWEELGKQLHEDHQLLHRSNIFLVLLFLINAVSDLLLLLR